MKQFLLSTPAQLVIWLSALAALVAIGGFIVGRLRDHSDSEQLSANSLLTNFRELHDQGDINAAEFRNIKTVLGVRLHEELNVSSFGGSEKSGPGIRSDQVDDSDSAEDSASV